MATKSRKSPRSKKSNSPLLEIAALRSSAEYRAAELRRRQQGDSGSMANAPESSADYAAVRLLIGTWDAIAIRYEGGGFNDDEFFTGLPVGYMWEALKNAIKDIRAKKGDDYASNFESMYKSYVAWRKKYDKKYESGADSGVHALFG
jgi:hypothetical protein